MANNKCRTAKNNWNANASTSGLSLHGNHLFPQWALRTFGHSFCSEAEADRV